MVFHLSKLRYFMAVLLVSVFLSTAVCAYEDIPPVNPPFTGGVYITGNTSQLGTVTVFIPVTYQRGYLGVTSSGNLFNVSSSTISGWLYRGSTEYTFRITSFSTPQYRTTSSSTYLDLTFTSLTASNAEIATSFPPLVSRSDVMALVPIFLMGVIVLCLFMKRS